MFYLLNKKRLNFKFSGYNRKIFIFMRVKDNISGNKVFFIILEKFKNERIEFR